MRRVALGLGLVLGAVLILGWWWTRVEAPEVAAPTARLLSPAKVPLVRGPGRAVIEAPVVSDETLLEDGAKGLLGLELSNRLCALCSSGGIVDDACRFCPEDGEARGRVNVDVVDENGKPYPDHVVMVSADCGRRGGGSGGFLDLPVGRCTLTPRRVDGVLDVMGAGVTVEVVAGEEQYALLELQSTAWGGAGIDLVLGDDGLRVRSLIPGSSAAQHALDGLILTHVGGTSVEGLLAQEAAHLINGPVGSQVELQLTNPQTGATTRVELERSLLHGSQVRPGITPG